MSRRRNGGWHLKRKPIGVSSISGPVTITERQIEVLEWLSEGKQINHIATILGITKRTVRFHLYRAMARLDCVTATQTVAVAIWMEII